MATRQEILDWCRDYLQVHAFKDYAPNGLQVEGRETIRTIATSVTASQAAIDFAAAVQADMLLVHHGMFWKSEPVTITGWKKTRIETLLQHQINMVGYHLPLDAHPKCGNNAQLAALLDWRLDSQCGEQNLLNIGRPNGLQTLESLAEDISRKLGRQPTVVGNLSKKINKIAWCTGGAQSFFQTAIEAGVDVYVTGEISEAQYHLANECDVAFISAGHHATERYGIQALAAEIQAVFQVEWQHFDEPNPA